MQLLLVWLICTVPACIILTKKIVVPGIIFLLFSFLSLGLSSLSV